ncbi:MAG TPA: arsenate reductase family protein [Bacteroidaceae bacterium]|nr:arsenate reductase family protein [Bacteroidaceae bacterium]
MLFICHTKCSTCKKAEKWLVEQGVTFEKRDIQVNNPTREEIAEWFEKSGLTINKLFNTSGQLYRQMGLKDRLKEEDTETLLDLLATDGMLVKRPILVSDKGVLFGFKEADYEKTAL